MQEDPLDGRSDYQRDLWEMEARQRQYRRFQQVFQIYAVLGALVGVLALAYFFVRRLDITLSAPDQFILLVAGSGFAVSALSGLYLFLRQQRLASERDRSRYASGAGEFLMHWARFEAVGRRRLEAAGRDFNRMSIRNIINQLLETGQISGEDVAQLEEALRFRNFLVHGGAPAEANLIATMSAALSRVLDRLEA